MTLLSGWVRLAAVRFERGKGSFATPRGGRTATGTHFDGRGRTRQIGFDVRLSRPCATPVGSIDGPPADR